jgi:hypothetical protein
VRSQGMTKPGILKPRSRSVLWYNIHMNNNKLTPFRATHLLDGAEMYLFPGEALVAHPDQPEVSGLIGLYSREEWGRNGTEEGWPRVRLTLKSRRFILCKVDGEGWKDVTSQVTPLSTPTGVDLLELWQSEAMEPVLLQDREGMFRVSSRLIPRRVDERIYCGREAFASQAREDDPKGYSLAECEGLARLFASGNYRPEEEWAEVAQ